MISVDTLRADHLPAYGATGVETPNLEALRKDSILFDNAVAHAPLTLPSHVSIFTGLLPFQHGVRDNLGYRVAPDARTLAGFFQAAGYATGGAVSSIVLSHTTGMNRGFDFYDDDVHRGERRRRAAKDDVEANRRVGRYRHDERLGREADRPDAHESPADRHAVERERPSRRRGGPERRLVDRDERTPNGRAARVVDRALNGSGLGAEWRRERQCAPQHYGE